MKTLKTFFTLLMILTIVLGTMAQTSQEYTVDEIDQFQTDLAAGTYDIYILSTSGGLYDLTTYIALTQEVVITSKDELPEKPILMRTNNTGTGAGIFRSEGTTKFAITFSGLAFNGNRPEGTAGQQLLAFRGNGPVDLIIEKCEFFNFSQNNGVIRFNAATSTLTASNSLFYNSQQRLIHLFETLGSDPGNLYGDILLNNCTFTGINGPVVFFRSASGQTAHGTGIYINHCTFDEIQSGADGLIRTRDEETLPVQIMNSVFTNITITGDDIIVNQNGVRDGNTVDYCYLGGITKDGLIATPPEATNSFDVNPAPVYANNAEFDFFITNNTSFRVANNDVAGNRMYYAPPTVFSVLEKIDNTNVKLTFSKTVDAVSAENTSNYSVGGTGGLTLQPSQAVLSNNREVTLTIEDMSNLGYLETIDITVTGVSDVNGILIAGDNVATYTNIDFIEPEKFLVTFTITYEGQDNDPVAIEGAIVSINGITESLTTDTDGNASIELENGSYVYSITAAGFVPIIESSFVIEDESQQINATLIIIPEPELPELIMAYQVVSNKANQFVTGISNKSGHIFIVKDDVEQSDITDLLAAVLENKGSSAQVIEAGKVVNIATTSLIPGIYNAFAVDADDLLSEVVSAIVKVNDFHSREYTVDELDEFENDLAVAAYDNYILSTSGGVYNMKNYIRIIDNTVIKSAEGLAERPTLMRTNNTGTGAGIFLVTGLDVTVVYDGLILDGTIVEGTNTISSLRVNSKAHVKINNCLFKNFTDNGGVVRLNTGGSTIDVRNSVFTDNAQRLIHLYTPNEVYGHVNIDNSVFANINGPVVFYRSAGGESAIGTTITVNHSTFYNIAGGADGLFRGRNNAQGETKILNSVFFNIASGTPLANSLATQVEYCYVEGMEPATEGTNLLTTAPVFEDPETLNFKITNSDELIAGTSDVAGVTWYYSPRVKPTLLLENATHVKVIFSRPVEAISAENIANYTLSGTFGLTGNPSSAELVNDREVLLNVGDISNVPNGETIIVTVTGVSDTNGVTIEGNNVAVFQVNVLEVNAAQQTVSNAPGQVAIVQSSFSTGYVYIVLSDEPQQTKADLDAAAAAAKGAFAVVTSANSNTNISTFNLIPGEYYAYAVSEEGDLSAKSTNSIELIDGIPPVVSNERQSAFNGPDNFVLAQSNEGNGRVYIIISGYPVSSVADLDAAVAANEGSYAVVTAADTDIQVSTSGLEPGIYYAYAVDAAGNISERGTEPLNIVQDDTSTEDFHDDALRVFSRNNIIYLQAPSSLNSLSYEVFDIHGRKIHSGIIGASSQIETTKSGIYIIRFGNTRVLPIRVLVLGL
jgi:hypothetical protein